MSKASIWMPLYIDDYLGDTTMLTAEQHGAYLLLLMTSWRNGGWLPDDDVSLAMASKLGRSWKKHRQTMEGFFTVAGGRWVNKRLAEELVRAERMAEISRENGRRGGRPRNPAGNPAGIPAGNLDTNPDGTCDLTREETPARVEGGRSVPPTESVIPSRELSAESQEKAQAQVIPLDGRKGR